MSFSGMKNKRAWTNNQEGTGQTYEEKDDCLLTY